MSNRRLKSIAISLTILSVYFIPQYSYCSFVNDEGKEKHRKSSKKTLAYHQHSESGENTLGRKKKKTPHDLQAKNKEFVNPDDIVLQKGKGSKETGGGTGGYFWHIYQEGIKTGKVFINLVNSGILGHHPSIQIYLNKKFQGRHIGRWAYQKACEQSRYDEIYAHMRKSNIASKKAALAAGFIILKNIKSTQLIMKWNRNQKSEEK